MEKYFDKYIVALRVSTRIILMKFETRKEKLKNNEQEAKVSPMPE